MQTCPVSSEPEGPWRLGPHARVPGGLSSLHCGLRGGQRHQLACRGRGLRGAGARLTSCSVTLCVESRGGFGDQRLEPRLAQQGHLLLCPWFPRHSQGSEQRCRGSVF